MIKIRAYKEPHYGRRIKLYGIDKVEGMSPKQISRDLKFIPVADGAEYGSFLDLEENSAQELIDSLWECGLRPSEGTGSAGAFAAQGKHLEDMRKLVFDDKN